MKYRHPLTSAIYELRDDGLIEVEEKGQRGVFYGDGRHASGVLTQADLHLLGWIASKQLMRNGAGADTRRHR